MQVVYHLGAHCTDEDKLFRCLLKNKGALAGIGTMVSGPGRYRRVLREATNALKGVPATPELQEDLLAAVMDEDHAERLVFSNEQFICAAHSVLAENRIYPQIGEKVQWIRNLFPEAAAEFYIGIANPATFIPDLFGRCKEEDFSAFLAGVTPTDLRWSDTLTAIRTAVPDARIVAWCNEDTPLIWPEILREMGGMPADMPIEGENDFLATIMSDEGVKRMESYLASHPVKTAQQRQRVVTAFLDKYARPEAVEVEMDLPGWNEATVEALTTLYLEDLARIRMIEGITFLAP
ncbi:hypothetical protein [Vannielia litorea]|uniref:hypothetical protein n=1 Tax=Vannielia litorea TaxID=1217970 RepID=UPI001C98AC52|nr:hypothetical protein [Vannielia litorea]MBY6046691.1 hypothetical protein [Vannielia litorea]MBY6074105.1 hypothetical protein [Vannielia litorea]